MKRAIIAAVIAICVGAVCFFAGSLHENERASSFNAAARALEETGLSRAYAPDYCLHGLLDAGRDSLAQTKFIIGDPRDRNRLMTDIGGIAGWAAAPVTAGEFLCFQQDHMWGYASVLDVRDDVVFDAWYYRETSGPVPEDWNWPDIVGEGALAGIGRVGSGFKFAVYDVDSGLFILVEQHG